MVLSVGVRFYYYIGSLSAGGTAGARPAGVEAFLPISALLGVKKLVLTGVYDIVHPAGLTILLAAVFISAVFKKGFCSSVCPVGFISEMVSKAGLNIRVHRFVFYPVASVKYLVLGFFVYIIFFQMDMRSAEMFINSPYNVLADAKMLNFFLEPSRTTLWTLLILAGLTLVITNFWCRFLCPYGALLGLFSMFSVFRVRRDENQCTDCRKCTSVCPMHINVHEKSTIYSPECFGCHECVKSRTQDACLSVTRMPYYRYVPVMITLFFAGAVVLAVLGGKWDSHVPQETYQYLLERIDQISH
jgi:polyferredoxin